VRKTFQFGLAGRDPLAEHVVGQHRRHGHGDAGGSHDQRLADGAADLVDADAAGRRNARQCVVDAPDGAEEADEGRRAAHAGEQHLAPLQVRQAAVQRVTQAARQLRSHLPCPFQRAGGRAGHRGV